MYSLENSTKHTKSRDNIRPMYLPQYAAFRLAVYKHPLSSEILRSGTSNGGNWHQGFFYKIALTMVGYEVENLNGPLRHVTQVSKIFYLFSCPRFLPDLWRTFSDANLFCLSGLFLKLRVPSIHLAPRCWMPSLAHCFSSPSRGQKL